MDLQDSYTNAWALWLAAFVVIEGLALKNKKPGDTLSEHVWAWFKIDKNEKNWNLPRVGLLAFLAWLIGHFVWRAI